MALRVSDDHPRWAVGLALSGLIAIVSLLELLRTRARTNEQPFTLRRVTDESGQIPAYLLAFLLPFLFLNAHEWRDVVAYLAFVALVAILVLRTDLVLVQPVLLAVGYHLYKVESTSGFKGILLSSTEPLEGQTISAVHLSRSALKLTLVQP